jgi:hypothetical protein
MKKLLLLPLLFLAFACSTDEMSDSGNKFLEKHDGTVWDYKVAAESDIIDFLDPNDQFMHNYLSIHNSISQYGFSNVFMLFNSDIYYEIDEPDTIDNYCNWGSVVWTLSDFNEVAFNLIKQSKNVLEWSYTNADYIVFQSLNIDGDDMALYTKLTTSEGEELESESISLEKVDDDSLLEKLKLCDYYYHTADTD